jgi:hypothetical protein
MLERHFAAWRSRFHPEGADALEQRLRDEVAALLGAGLDEDEAFVIAVKRVGEFDAASGQHSARLWRQLLLPPDVVAPDDGRAGGAWLALGLAVAAAVAFRLPELFGVRLVAEDGPGMFYVRNFGFFALPLLAVFFALRRSLTPADRVRLAVPFLAGLLCMNLYPFRPGGHTEALAVIHVLVALWLAVGFAHAGGRWRDPARRMDFVRFSGEWFIQYTLIALGGGVLMLFTVFIFDTIGVDVEHALSAWVIPCGVVGAVIIAAWLVDARPGVIGNMAPVLTMLFTPLFTLALLVFLGTVAWTGSAIGVGREVLIGFDLLLVLVVGLYLYALSARDPQRGPGAFDVLQLVLVVCALLVDALALSAILGRISGFGFSPNRVAGLGLNVILVVNLAWAAVLQARFVTGRGGLAPVVRWQMACLPVYALWAWVVVLLLPPLFGFV